VDEHDASDNPTLQKARRATLFARRPTMPSVSHSRCGSVKASKRRLGKMAAGCRILDVVLDVCALLVLDACALLGFAAVDFRRFDVHLALRCR
jgi:hypothetical protein